GTGDPDDHLKIFESATTIENWPQPVWCHMFNSTLVGNTQNWFSKLPHRSIDGFEESRRAFRLNLTQRKKVPQTFNELMKRTRSFIQGEAVAADSKKSYSNYKSREQPRRQTNDQSSNHNNSYRNQRGDRGNDKSPSPYNGIIGRPGISAIRAVPSTAHWMLKFPVDGGIVTIYNTTVPTRECNTVACDATQTQTQYAAKVINLKVAIHPDYPEQEVSIGGRCLTETGRRCAHSCRGTLIFFHGNQST
nr:reverse transcriptase domain-containing protein [Tanacetum cinerariifolium]